MEELLICLILLVYKKGEDTMSIFALALQQARLEGKEEDTLTIIEYAQRIREYLDMQQEKREQSQFKKVI